MGAIIAPFFVGLIADRLFNTQRVLALLHIAGAILLYIASLQTSFLPFYGIALAYCLCFMPTLVLTICAANTRRNRLYRSSAAFVAVDEGKLVGFVAGHSRVDSVAGVKRRRASADGWQQRLFSIVLL